MSYKPKLTITSVTPWRPGLNVGSSKNTSLVGGFNPFEKYARQIGSFPQVGLNIKNAWNHHLVVALGKVCKKTFFRGTILQAGRTRSTWPTKQTPAAVWNDLTHGIESIFLPSKNSHGNMESFFHFFVGRYIFTSSPFSVAKFSRCYCWWPSEIRRENHLGWC